MKQIEHIYPHIDGWFDFQTFYRKIAEWIPDGGKWVEVGVYSGKSFSFGIIECLNRGKKVEFTAVDMFPTEWIYIGNKPPVREMFDKAMKPLEGHFNVKVGKSVDMAKQFKNESIDFIFIDAGHDYQNCKNDLEAWYPKVRHGGLFSGDDYGICVDDRRLSPFTVDRQKWKDLARIYKWGTAIALHEFCEARKLQLNITWLNDFSNPAWYIIKP